MPHHTRRDTQTYAIQFQNPEYPAGDKSDKRHITHPLRVQLQKLIT
jgi:hypothetical protein